MSAALVQLNWSNVVAAISTTLCIFLVYLLVLKKAVNKVITEHVRLLTPTEFTASLTKENNNEIPRNGFRPDMRIKRNDLVEHIISELEAAEDKHIFVRGARGCGKTVLLEELSRALADNHPGKRVLVATDPAQLERWFLVAKNRPDMMPDYLLVDEVQDGFTLPSVRYFANKDMPSKVKPRTVFAGIPSNPGASCILHHVIDVKRLLLSEEELLKQPAIMEFIVAKLRAGSADLDPTAVASSSDQSSLSNRSSSTTGDQLTTAAEKLLSFVRAFTSGHMYPCIKIAAHLATRVSAADLFMAENDHSLTRALAGAEFEAVRSDIERRCFESERFSAVQIAERLRWPAVADSDLQAMGLWIDKWLISPLFYMVLQRYKANQDVDDTAPRFEQAEQIGAVLDYCFRRMNWNDFHQRNWDTSIGEVRTRFAIGVHLTRVCGSVGFQHVVPVTVRRPGRTPTVNYYLASTLNMYLEVVKDRSELNEHFHKFSSGGKYGQKQPFALLDVDFTHMNPLPLPTKHAHHADRFFTFCVKSTTLFNGHGDVVPSAGLRTGGAAAGRAIVGQHAAEKYEELHRRSTQKDPRPAERSGSSGRNKKARGKGATRGLNGTVMTG